VTSWVRTLIPGVGSDKISPLSLYVSSQINDVIGHSKTQAANLIVRSVAIPVKAKYRLKAIQPYNTFTSIDQAINPRFLRWPT